MPGIRQVILSISFFRFENGMSIWSNQLCLVYAYYDRINIKLAALIRQKQTVVTSFLGSFYFLGLENEGRQEMERREGKRH